MNKYKQKLYLYNIAFLQENSKYSKLDLMIISYHVNSNHISKTF